jgi:hypothetical protein
MRKTNCFFADQCMFGCNVCRHQLVMPGHKTMTCATLRTLYDQVTLSLLFVAKPSLAPLPIEVLHIFCWALINPITNICRWFNLLLSVCIIRGSIQVHVIVLVCCHVQPRSILWFGSVNPMQVITFHGCQFCRAHWHVWCLGSAYVVLTVGVGDWGWCMCTIWHVLFLGIG